MSDNNQNDAFLVQSLQECIKGLRERIEVESQRGDYFEDQFQQLSKTVKAIELLDCSIISIENNGSDSEPWEISVSPIQGDEWTRYRRQKQYCGATLLQALERLAKKEVAS